MHRKQPPTNQPKYPPRYLPRSEVVVKGKELEAREAMGASDWANLEAICTQELNERKQDERWAMVGLAYALTRQMRYTEAEQAYATSLEHHPADEELQLNWANFLLERGRPQEAMPQLVRLTSRHPQHSMTWALLASAHYQLRSHEQGFQAAMRAAKFASTPAETNFALQQTAIHRRELGQIQEAIRDCEKGLEIAPNDLGHHTNRMLFLLAAPDTTDAQLHNAAKDFARAVEEPHRSAWPSFENRDRTVSRRLRVGFISPDLRNHSVMYFTLGLLSLLDRGSFTVVALHLHPNQDAITDQVARLADEFHDLAGLKLENLVATVRQLELDVLVDLAGHTGHNALAAMARKLAPVQVSTLGYPGTTGLTAIDYRISDPITDPEDAQRHYTEQLWRLNALFCVYRPSIRNPLYRYQPAYAVHPLPALKNGYVTFGSCTNLGRLTDEVLATWGQVLGRMPTSRLLIEGKELDVPSFAAAFGDRCEGLGLPRDRLELVGQDFRNQYLTYHRIDICLDPFPLNSGTTSFDSLWMGVPFVTLTGDSFRGRIGTGLLLALGLEILVTHTQEAYVAAACDLAADLHSLAELRQQLRPLAESSVLMHEAHYVKEFGNALRLMWAHWAEPSTRRTSADMSSICPPPEERWVALAPRKRMPLAQAYEHIAQLIERAKAETTPSTSESIESPRWIAVQDLAEQILLCHTNDAVALSALAEIEHAHGHTAFAACYLGHAMRAMEQAQVHP